MKTFERILAVLGSFALFQGTSAFASVQFDTDSCSGISGQYVYQPPHTEGKFLMSITIAHDGKTYFCQEEESAISLDGVQHDQPGKEGYYYTADCKNGVVSVVRTVKTRDYRWEYYSVSAGGDLKVHVDTAEDGSNWTGTRIGNDVPPCLPSVQ